MFLLLVSTGNIKTLVGYYFAIMLFQPTRGCVSHLFDIIACHMVVDYNAVDYMPCN